jgi:hypothetical protein
MPGLDFEADGLAFNAMEPPAEVIDLFGVSEHDGRETARLPSLSLIGGTEDVVKVGRRSKHVPVGSGCDRLAVLTQSWYCGFDQSRLSRRIHR